MLTQQCRANYKEFLVCLVLLLTGCNGRQRAPDGGDLSQAPRGIDGIETEARKIHGIVSTRPAGLDSAGTIEVKVRAESIIDRVPDVRSDVNSGIEALKAANTKIAELSEGTKRLQNLVDLGFRALSVALIGLAGFLLAMKLRLGLWLALLLTATGLGGGTIIVGLVIVWLPRVFVVVIIGLVIIEILEVCWRYSRLPSMESRWGRLVLAIKASISTSWREDIAELISGK